MEFSGLADLLLRRRRLTVAVLIAASAVALVGVLNVGFDDNVREVFRSNDDQFRLMEEVFEQFGTDENNAYLIVTAGDLFSLATIDELRALVAAVSRVEGIESVVSLVDETILVADPLPLTFPLPRTLIPQDATAQSLAKARETAIAHPLIAGRLLSEDGRSTLVTARLAGNALPIKEIQPVVEQLWELAEQWTRDSPLQVHVTGLPAIRSDAFALVRSESLRFTALGVLAALAISVFLLQRVAPIIIVCSAAFIGAFWTVGALGLIGEKITVLTTVLPMLVMVIGFADSIHLMVDIRHSRKQGINPSDSTRLALRHLTVACLFTSITTAIGFGSLSVTSTEIIRRFGLVCAMGAGLTFVSVITVLPILASSRLGWGVLPPHLFGVDRWLNRIAESIVDWSLRRRWFVTVSGIALSVVLLLVVSRIRPENEISENLPYNSRGGIALRMVDKAFGGILPAFICVDYPSDRPLESPEVLRALQRVEQICTEEPGLHHPISIRTFLDSFPGANLGAFPLEVVRSFVRLDLDRAVVVSRVPDSGSEELTSQFAAVQRRLDELKREFPSFQFRLTGSAVNATRNLNTMITDLAVSLTLALVVIFFTMTLMFRSLRLGLICLLPNALPLLVTAAVLALVDGHLRLVGVIVFSVCLGIAVDDTIHLVVRFQREWRDGRSIDEALRRSAVAVGSALMITTIVLIVGLAIPMTSDVPGNRMFGWMACVAIATALIGDLVLLPAMLACFLPKRRGQPAAIRSNTTV